jgi:enamine deaminase RidA (YjgF/YER057c/UK114 family)
MPKRRKARPARGKKTAARAIKHKARFLNPPALYKPPGYSHVVEVTGPGRIVYLAGQLGFDTDGNLVGDDFRSQAEQTFVNVKSALAAVGAGMADVVKINTYIVDIGQHLSAFRDVRNRHMNMAAPPASTTVGVPALARVGALIEVEAVAILP